PRPRALDVFLAAKIPCAGDKIGEIGIEPRCAQRAAFVRQIIINSRVAAARALGAQVRIAVIERTLPVEIQKARRTETRSIARAQLERMLRHEPRSRGAGSRG